ncbi:MAG: HDOD domain-containing protein [Verrucomicrobia bacterium]|nr:HDOD domain-containing protein [Verrucomicrobiota bacterium]
MSSDPHAAKPRLRVLFVDDEPIMVKLLELAMQPMRFEWDLKFAVGPKAALALLDGHMFDLVVSDMRMPDMTGVELLDEVRRRQPRTIRIILSGYAERISVMRSLTVVHQFLAKPFNIPTLKAALERIRHFQDRMLSEELRALVGQISALPSVPTVYLEMLDALEKPDCSIDQIADIIGSDPGLIAKMLQLVNSAFFGMARTVSDAKEAVQLLGVNVIRSLALTIHIFSTYDEAQFSELPLTQVWNHSLRTSSLAKRIVQLEGGSDEQQDQARTAGLLHDVGKMILAANLTDTYLDVLRRARQSGTPLCQVEEESFRANHAGVGAYLLGLWGLPSPLVEAVGFHHTPWLAGDTRFSPLTAVHAADAIEHCPADLPVESAPALAATYLEELGLWERLPVWKAAAEDLRSAAAG